MIFPGRLKAAREYRQMTQAQLAEAIGFPPGTVAGWEAGKFRPRGAHLLEASIILGVTPAMLTRERDEARAILRDILERIGRQGLNQALIDRARRVAESGKGGDDATY